MILRPTDSALTTQRSGAETASAVRLTADQGVAELVLARAEARNAINAQWVDDFAAAVAGLSAASDARAVLVRAEGPAFSVGGDLDHFGSRLDDLPGELNRMVSGYHDALQVLAELNLPVICAARGAIAGGALGILWAADIVILGDDAKLATGFARLGLSGDGGNSWYLPRLIGLRRATELIMQGRVLSAGEAVAWGLANSVADAEELDDVARGVARSLANGPPAAYGEMRRLIRNSFELSLREGLDGERDATVRCGATSDARAGIRAFVDGRHPEFLGR